MDSTACVTEWDVIEHDPYGRIVSLTAWSQKNIGERPYVFLVPIDGSPSSLSAMHVALQLAEHRPDAELHILNVQLAAGNDACDNPLERDGLHETREARHFLDTNRKCYQLHIATGPPANAILDYSRQHNVAEIVIGSHGADYFKRLLLGSVAMDVSRESRKPVTIVKSSPRAGRFPAEWVDWLIPCDGSPSALRAVRHALRYSACLDSKPKLHLLNIRQHESPASGKSLASDWLSRQLSPRDLRADGELQCEEALAVLEQSRQAFAFHVEAGDPATRILDAIERLGCGHVAMGSRGLGMLGRLVLGSVSQAVVQGAAIPVTLIK